MKNLKVRINKEELVAKEVIVIEDKKTTHNIMVVLEDGYKFFDSEKVKEITVNGVQYEKTAFLSEDGFDYKLCYWHKNGRNFESLPSKRSFELPQDHEWYTSQGMWTIGCEDEVWFPKLLKVGERTYEKRFVTEAEAQAMCDERNENVAQRKMPKIKYGDIKSQLVKKYYLISDNTPVERLEEYIERQIAQANARSSKLAQASLKLLKIDLNTIKQIRRDNE